MDPRTDGRTDIWTDAPSYRDATAHLKRKKNEKEKKDTKKKWKRPRKKESVKLFYKDPNSVITKARRLKNFPQHGQALTLWLEKTGRKETE